MPSCHLDPDPFLGPFLLTLPLHAEFRCFHQGGGCTAPPLSHCCCCSSLTLLPIHSAPSMICLTAMIFGKCVECTVTWYCAGEFVCNFVGQLSVNHIAPWGHWINMLLMATSHSKLTSLSSAALVLCDALLPWWCQKCKWSHEGRMPSSSCPAERCSYDFTGLMWNMTGWTSNLTWDGTLFGGSMRMLGSHPPGGSTVTWSRNSSIPDSRSFLSFAL